MRVSTPGRPAYQNLKAMPPFPDTPAARRRAVAWAVALTAGTSLAPRRYERYLLDRYQGGVLTIDEVIELLEASVYQVLYRSRATRPLGEAQLQELLEYSRAYNARYQITGLLLYSDGRFVQVLEGDEAPVRALFARIQQDSRHTQVVTLREGPGPQRRFADWQMAFGHVAAPALDQVLGAVNRPAPEPVAIDDPHLQALLKAFGPLAPCAAG